MATVTYTVSGTQMHPRKPKIKNNLTIKVTRENKQTKRVTISITGTITPAASTEFYRGPFSNPQTGFYFSTHEGIDDRHGNYYNLKYGTNTNINVSWGENWTSGTLNIYSHCGFGDSGDHSIHCSYDYDDIILQSIDISKLPYEEYIDPTNFTSGKVFNQNGVQNGDEKPDRCIKVTWSGENPGSYSFDTYSIDLFKVSGHYDDNTYRIGSFSNVSKDVLYDLDNISYNGSYRDLNNRHVRPGDTLYVCIRAHSTKGSGGSWLPRYYIGTIKLYKNGKILYRQSNGTGVECTKLYYKQSNGTVQKGRYAFYKQNNNTIKVIDMYTYCYE